MKTTRNNLHDAVAAAAAKHSELELLTEMVERLPAGATVLIWDDGKERRCILANTPDELRELAEAAVSLVEVPATEGKTQGPATVIFPEDEPSRWKLVSPNVYTKDGWELSIGADRWVIRKGDFKTAVPIPLNAPTLWADEWLAKLAGCHMNTGWTVKSGSGCWNLYLDEFLVASRKVGDPLDGYRDWVSNCRDSWANSWIAKAREVFFSGAKAADASWKFDGLSYHKDGWTVRATGAGNWEISKGSFRATVPMSYRGLSSPTDLADAWIAKVKLACEKSHRGWTLRDDDGLHTETGWTVKASEDIVIWELYHDGFLVSSRKSGAPWDGSWDWANTWITKAREVFGVRPLHDATCDGECGGTFACDDCGREVGWCLGADDNHPESCNDCWSKKEAMP